MACIIYLCNVKMLKIFIILVILLCLDFVYMFVFKNLFIDSIRKIQNGRDIQINYVAVLITYLILSTALYYFIINPKKSIKDAFLFGICIYGIYEFTNLSILKDWNMKVVLIDTLWGGTLMFLTTLIYYRFNK